MDFESLTVTNPFVYTGNSNEIAYLQQEAQLSTRAYSFILCTILISHGEVGLVNVLAIYGKYNRDPFSWVTRGFSG